MNDIEKGTTWEAAAALRRLAGREVIGIDAGRGRGRGIVSVAALINATFWR